MIKKRWEQEQNYTDAEALTQIIKTLPPEVVEQLFYVAQGMKLATRPSQQEQKMRIKKERGEYTKTDMWRL